MNTAKQSILAVLADALVSSPAKYEQLIRLTGRQDGELGRVIEIYKNEFSQSGDLQGIIAKLIQKSNNSEQRLAGKALLWALERKEASRKK